MVSGLWRKTARYGLVALVLGLVWQVLSAGLGSAVLPPPLEVAGAFVLALGGPEFWGHFQASALRALAAMFLAFGLAFPLGLVLGGSRRADALFGPFVLLTYPIPKIVFLPVFLVLLGLGDGAKVAVIVLILGYQILVTTRDGVRAVHPRYVDSVRSLGGGKWDILWDVHLPAALPHGFTALRLGTGVSVAVLFFVESFATQQGLGYLIMDAWGRMDYVGMFIGILGMSILGAALYEAVDWLERRACAWMRARRR